MANALLIFTLERQIAGRKRGKGVFCIQPPVEARARRLLDSTVALFAFVLGSVPPGLDPSHYLHALDKQQCNEHQESSFLSFGNRVHLQGSKAGREPSSMCLG